MIAFLVGLVIGSFGTLLLLGIVCAAARGDHQNEVAQAYEDGRAAERRRKVFQMVEA